MSGVESNSDLDSISKSDNESSKDDKLYFSSIIAVISKSSSPSTAGTNSLWKSAWFMSSGWMQDKKAWGKII